MPVVDYQLQNNYPKNNQNKKPLTIKYFSKADNCGWTGVV